ncbi:MAG: flavodoxin family protein [Synergistales bacterium]|nr:flavodoxin family protein [Synergistales bacterium]
MKVVGFNGSPREQGNTAAMIGEVFAALRKEGIETELVQVGGKPVRGCTACMRCRESADGTCVINDDELNDWLQKMAAADGIILGSPTYFSDLTPEMKALIDRAGFVARGSGGLLRRKVGAAVVAVRRAGGVHVFDSINHLFLISEMIVPGSVYWNIGQARDIGDFARDEEGIATMRKLGENMAWLLKRVAA